MKTSKIIAAAALTLLAAAGAQAETYEGVHPLVSANSRATVRAEAVTAARADNPYADGAESGLPAVIVSSVGRPTVRSQAVAAAHSADPYAEGANAGVAPIVASTVNRDAVRAEARAAARSNALSL
ncbi:helicase SNF2 [Variovorax sp. GT1P44]|uniref:helicase SNF2 n=1 Tax=Variovorax sp. GT1P44 TaxID=3443742 RepID=UPI003F45C0CA